MLPVLPCSCLHPGLLSYRCPLQGDSFHLSAYMHQKASPFNEALSWNRVINSPLWSHLSYWVKHQSCQRKGVRHTADAKRFIPLQNLDLSDKSQLQTRTAPSAREAAEGGHFSTTLCCSPLHAGENSSFHAGVQAPTTGLSGCFFPGWGCWPMHRAALLRGWPALLVSLPGMSDGGVLGHPPAAPGMEEIVPTVTLEPRVLHL